MSKINFRIPRIQASKSISASISSKFDAFSSSNTHIHTHAHTLSSSSYSFSISNHYEKAARRKECESGEGSSSSTSHVHRPTLLMKFHSLIRNSEIRLFLSIRRVSKRERKSRFPIEVNIESGRMGEIT
jgi:hypothetical protein